MTPGSFGLVLVRRGVGANWEVAGSGIPLGRTDAKDAATERKGKKRNKANEEEGAGAYLIVKSKRKGEMRDEGEEGHDNWQSTEGAAHGPLDALANSSAQEKDGTAGVCVGFLWENPPLRRYSCLPCNTCSGSLYSCKPQNHNASGVLFPEYSLPFWCFLHMVF